jgi:hypothetical protein
LPASASQGRMHRLSPAFLASLSSRQPWRYYGQ